MSQPQGGSGLGLPIPQYLFPSELNNAARDVASNYLTLPPGEALVLPAGHLLINCGLYSFIQEMDPVTGTWRGFSTARAQRQWMWSDGQNIRVANLTGCPVAAVVVVGGSGYAQASTTVTASAGGSTWQPIVGGMVSLSTISAAGAGYGIAPNLLIAAPPNPGVQATGYCTLASGTVSGITLTNVGAGYPTAPRAVIVPSQFDPNLASAITPAVAAFAVVGAGSIAAVICTNNGAPVAAAPTLTVAGVGASASVAAVMCNTITAGSVALAGAGFTGGAAFTTFGGIPSAVPQWTNPAIQLTSARPRDAEVLMATVGGSLISVSTIYDGGLFFGAPAVAVQPLAGSDQVSVASVTITLGSSNDTLFVTTAP